MPTVTLTIGEETKAEFKRFSWVNWSEAAREELAEQERLMEAFEKFKSIVAKSKFTEKDALEIGRKINENLYREYKKRHGELK